MSYLGWKNPQTMKTWGEIVLTQDEILPIVQAVTSEGQRGIVKRLAAALEARFRKAMPLQEIEGDYYVHDFWGSLLDQSFTAIDWRSIASNILWQLSNPEQHPDVAGKGGRKQDWSTRDRLWTSV